MNFPKEPLPIQRVHAWSPVNNACHILVLFTIQATGGGGDRSDAVDAGAKHQVPGLAGHERPRRPPGRQKA